MCVCVCVWGGGVPRRYPNKTLRIIVAGLNYFHGHRFRSRVFVQFGEPLFVPAASVLRFCAGGEAKREECNALLARVQRSLESVTTNAESREQLQVCARGRMSACIPMRGPVCIRMHVRVCC